MSLLRLAWLLVVRGRGVRVWGMVLASSLTVLLLVVVASLPAALVRGDATQSERVLVGSVALFLLVPAVVLLTAVSRLSADTKARRLATMRMLGLTARQSRLVTASENGLLALAGGLVGIGLSTLVCRVVSPALVGAGLVRRELRPSVILLLAAWVGVAVVAAGVSAVSVRRLGGNAFAVRARAASRPSSWRLLLPLGGLVTSTALLRVDTPGHEQSPLFFAASILSLAAMGGGVVLVLPLASYAAASRLASSGVPALKLAGRRMQVDPGAAGRVVAGVAVSMFLVTGAAGVLAAFQSTSIYRTQKRAVEHGPQLVLVSYDPTTPHIFQSVRDVAGVRGVVVRYDLSARPVGSTDGTEFDVFYGSCADLQMLQPGARGCSERPAWIVSEGSPAEPVNSHGRLVVQRAAASGVSGGATIAVSRSAIHLSTREPEVPGFQFAGTLFVPRAAPELRSLRPSPMLGVAVTDPGYPVLDRLSSVGVPAPARGLAYYEAANTWAVVVWSLVALALAISVVAVTVTAIDRAQERRRETAAQVAVGVPARVLRLGQCVHVAVPLAVAVLASIGAGVIGTSAFLHATSTMLQTAPFTIVGQVALAAGASIAIIAVSSMVGIRTTLTPELLRRQ